MWRFWVHSFFVATGATLCSFCSRLFTAALAVGLTGCASVFGRKFQNVTFDSEPPQAVVYVDGKFVGKTPVVLVTPVVRSKKEVAQQRALLKSGDISAEEFDDFKKGIHKVVVTKEGIGTKQFYITPRLYHKHGANFGLCVFDAIYGPIFVGIPIGINAGTGFCRGFDKVYKVDLSSRQVAPNLYSGAGIGAGR